MEPYLFQKSAFPGVARTMPELTGWAGLVERQSNPTSASTGNSTGFTNVTSGSMKTHGLSIWDCQVIVARALSRQTVRRLVSILNSTG
jgi:hypothetical protein